MPNPDHEKKADALAEAIVNGYPSEAIEDIVKQALASDSTQKERIETALNSGIYAGARLAYMSSMAMEEDIVTILKDTIERCDAAIQATDDADTMMAISKVRNPIALFFQEQDRRFQQSVAAGLGTAFNIPTSLITTSTPTDEIDRELVIAIGRANLIESRTLFLAFMSKRHSNLECRCPAHMLMAFKEDKPSAEELLAKLEREFPDPDDGLYIFGLYLLDYCRKVFSENAQPHFDVSAISEKEADKMAEDFLSKLKTKHDDGE